MNTLTERALYWSPRVLGILISLFLGLFALDVFAEGYSFWLALGGFLIHLLPTYIVLLTLLVAWRWERVGGALFIALGMFYILWARGMHWSAYVLISGPLFVCGALFLACWACRERG